MKYGKYQCSKKGKKKASQAENKTKWGLNISLLETTLHAVFLNKQKVFDFQMSRTAHFYTPGSVSVQLQYTKSVSVDLRSLLGQQRKYNSCQAHYTHNIKDYQNISRKENVSR